MSSNAEAKPNIQPGWNSLKKGFAIFVGGIALTSVGFALSDTGRGATDVNTGQHFNAQETGKYNPEDTLLEILGGITAIGGATIMLSGANKLNKPN